MAQGDHHGWSVALAVQSAMEQEALSQHAARVLEVGTYHFWQDEVDDIRAMEIVSRAPARADAVAWAERQFGRIAELAGLTSEPHLISATSDDWEARATFLGPTRDFGLMAEAERLMNDHYYEWAVVAAQAACEMRTRAAILDAAAPLVGEAMMAEFRQGVRQAALTNPELRRHLHMFLRVGVTDLADWERHKRHIERRNRIVHRGERVGAVEARESVDACRDALTVVDRAWTDTLVRQGRLAES
ncbi:MAG: hypothetical protein JHC95_12555 [Solirubrobacteraceae bacterium]|nr:hypothetical protein [Solirubrobacteraceae bacterium]